MSAIPKNSVVEEIITAIRVVMEYNWDFEPVDYEQQDSEGREGHVFYHLASLKTWLSQLIDSVIDTEVALEWLNMLAKQLGITSVDHLDEAVDDTLDQADSIRLNNGETSALGFLEDHDALHDDFASQASQINNKCACASCFLVRCLWRAATDDVAARLCWRSDVTWVGIRRWRRRLLRRRYGRES